MAKDGLWNVYGPPDIMYKILCECVMYIFKGPVAFIGFSKGPVSASKY